eukprot:68115_1
MNLKVGLYDTLHEEKEHPYLEPVIFEMGDKKWSTELVMPYSWVEQKSKGEWFRLKINDIWGKTYYFTFSSEYQSWCRIKSLNGELKVITNRLCENEDQIIQGQI